MSASFKSVVASPAARTGFGEAAFLAPQTHAAAAEPLVASLSRNRLGESSYTHAPKRGDEKGFGEEGTKMVTPKTAGYVPRSPAAL
ncbi:hypothetical protein HPB50_009020 [Hyalomma asiaticum]|uniref:Uncharacterized protein n=1 Tax=Hyalomma asiaticum TaxID=266040 RepID=A0ACB7SUI4_HYAAI|nr:hypothetical protein HPB50_009020 [Hyalomma asiaticum]